MRQIHKHREEAPGRKVREPLAEGVAKKPRSFNQAEIDYVIRRRNKLEEEGMTDSRIAEKIAEGIGRSAGCIRQKIRILVNKGMLDENQNKVKQFSGKEIAFMKKRRGELEKEGLADGQIVKQIAAEMGRSAGSIHAKILRLVSDGRLGENPNNNEKKKFSEEEIAFMKRRRVELERGGMNDRQIAKKISVEMGRSADSVGQKIRKLVSGGRLGENPNKQEQFSDDGVALLMKRRAELEKEGLNDNQAAKRIAREMGKRTSSVEGKIKGLRGDKLLAENKNRMEKKEFSVEEIALLMKRRAELEKEGLKDRGMAEKIAGEMRRSAGSLREKIRKLVDIGQLAENRNKEGRKEFSDEEIASIISRRAELEKAGLKDEHIAEKIAGEMGRTTSSVKKKIWNLVRCGKLGSNENKVKNRPRGFFKNMSDEELVEYAKNEMDEKGVGSRKELQSSDWGLYGILLRRGLMDAVFAEVEQKARDEVLGQLREAVDLYTGEET